MYLFTGKTSANWCVPQDSIVTPEIKFTSIVKGKISATQVLSSPLFQQQVDLPTKNAFEYSKPLLIQDKAAAQCENSLWSGNQDSLHPPNWKADCFWALDWTLPKQFAQLLGYPGNVVLNLEFLCDHVDADYRGSEPSLEIDVSRFLKQALLTKIGIQASGNAWLARVQVAGIYAYDAVAPEISLIFKEKKMQNPDRQNAGIYLKMQGVWSAAYFDAELVSKVMEDGETSISGDWDLVSVPEA